MSTDVVPASERFRCLGCRQRPAREGSLWCCDACDAAWHERERDILAEVVAWVRLRREGAR